MSQATELPIAEQGARSSGCTCTDCPNGNNGQCGEDKVHGKNGRDAKGDTANGMLAAPDRVLPTLDNDGSRRWLSPKLAKGVLWKYRRIVSYVLMAVFLVTPHLRWNGKPLILLDIAHRKFLLFGTQFLPTDTPLLAILVVATVLLVVFATAVFGRVWCGWACPQTVYLEFLFRPIDRFFTGTVGRGGKPRGTIAPWKQLARVGVYVLLSAVIANSFLAFFVGAEALGAWMTSSPLDHPVAFTVMAVITAAFVADFLWFREQFCTVACPYGRFQSVMLDRQSLIVAYDEKRGEPRRKGKRSPDDTAGDCIECNQCVVVCPTGIDIRDGLQMECINCTQCIDACDAVMTKLKKPTGLIRYSSQDALDGKESSFWRARTVIYPVLIAALGVLFVFALSRTTGFNASLLRATGQPFVMQGREVQNSVRLRLVNRTDSPQSYSIDVVSPEGVTARFLDGTPELQSQGTNIEPLLFSFSPSLTAATGQSKATVIIRDGSANERQLSLQLLGPPQ